MLRPHLLPLLIAWSSLTLSATSHAEQVLVAVAANFTAPMKEIAHQFAEESDHQAKLSFGATGALYAQISHGAPFAVLLAADDKTTARLAQEQHAVAASEFTYAKGKLVLWSKDPTLVDSDGNVLNTDQFKRLAVANPRTAPYGLAAQEYLTTKGLYDRLKPKLVTGTNITQTFQFVSSGNAELGFVALSQVYRDGEITQGAGWQVPMDSYSPIRQNAILLNPGRNSEAAAALLAFLRSDKATAIIKSYGYDL